MPKVTCKIANVWTTKGKLLKGESVEVDQDEADALGSAVEVAKPAKKKAKK